MQDVVQSLIFLGALDCHDIPRTFHDTDHAVVAGRVRADLADLAVGQILADRAGTDLFMCLQDGVRKLLCLVMRHIQHVKSKPLSRLASNARKAGKLLN